MRQLPFIYTIELRPVVSARSSYASSAHASVMESCMVQRSTPMGSVVRRYS